MRTKVVCFYLLALVLGGCIPSLHPIYTEKEVVFDERLLGTWGESEGRWVFERGSDNKSYDLTCSEDGKEGKFTVHLVKLDQMLFLDLFPEDPNLNTTDFYKIHLLPVHTFLRVDQIDPVLKMRAIDRDKFTSMLGNDPNLIKHEEVCDLDVKIVLTASTQELQEFLKRHANDEGLFGEPSDFIRQAGDPNEGILKPK